MEEQSLFLTQKRQGRGIADEVRENTKQLKVDHEENDLFVIKSSCR
ncbi:hypothetical protein [Breznakia sp. PFB2-8]|nr:hypothetical protein [Breznakia sp. PFB2-8]MDF9837549.1 hypothetical protein [Breznakia sp. PFB2-8]